LIKKGILEMYGSKKGAYYADASKNMDESKWDLNAAKKDYIITQPYNFSKNYNIASIYIIMSRRRPPSPSRRSTQK